MRVDASCACRLFVAGARALWTFGLFPAAVLIKYILILISINIQLILINRNSIAMLELEQYSYISIHRTIYLQPADIMLS